MTSIPPTPYAGALPGVVPYSGAVGFDGVPAGMAPMPAPTPVGLSPMPGPMPGSMASIPTPYAAAMPIGSTDATPAPIMPAAPFAPEIPADIGNPYADIEDETK